MSVPVHVYVLGTGGVGKAFLSQLKSLKTQFPSFKLAAITTSKRSVVASESDSWIELQDDAQQKGLDPNEILELCQKLKSPAKAVVVDNTSNQAVANAYPAFLKAGISVVTPNKKAFSGSWQLWDDIQKAAWSPHNHAGGFVYHESSCGAGLPIISTLNDLILSGDKVVSIEGVFSGTMSFLFNSFAPVNGAGGKWSAEVSKAKNLGYTEPDPRDDLNGLDVARKLVILARIAGLQVSDTSAFPVQSLIPEALKDCKSGEEFMQRLPEFDEQMEAVKTDAENQGKVVRFVGSIDVPAKSLKVGLEQFAKDHPVANLKGADNIISFRTERYSNTPLIIQGAGAGADVTAMGVTADLIKVFQRLSPVA